MSLKSLKEKLLKNEKCRKHYDKIKPEFNELKQKLSEEKDHG